MRKLFFEDLGVSKHFDNEFSDSSLLYDITFAFLGDGISVFLQQLSTMLYKLNHAWSRDALTVFSLNVALTLGLR